MLKNIVKMRWKYSLGEIPQDNVQRMREPLLETHVYENGHNFRTTGVKAKINWPKIVLTKVKNLLKNTWRAPKPRKNTMFLPGSAGFCVMSNKILQDSMQISLGFSCPLVVGLFKTLCKGRKACFSTDSLALVPCRQDCRG